MTSGQVDLNEKALFFGGVASLIQAGIRLTQALESAAKASLSQNIDEVIHSVREGNPLSVALTVKPELFTTHESRVLGMAEEAGDLHTYLIRLSEDLERAQERGRQLRMIGWGLAIVFHIALLLPGIPHLPQSPAGYLKLTASLFAISYSLALVGVLAWKAASAHESFELKWDHLILRLPFVGPALRKQSLAQFLHSLAPLVAAGLSLPRALVTSANAPANRKMAEVLRHQIDGAGPGDSLSDVVRPVLPQNALGLLTIGEESGKLDSQLRLAAELLDRESRAAAQPLAVAVPLAASLIILMGSLGLMVGVSAYTKTPKPVEVAVRLPEPGPTPEQTVKAPLSTPSKSQPQARPTRTAPNEQPKPKVRRRPQPAAVKPSASSTPKAKVKPRIEPKPKAARAPKTAYPTAKSRPKPKPKPKPVATSRTTPSKAASVSPTKAEPSGKFTVTIPTGYRVPDKGVDTYISQGMPFRQVSARKLRDDEDPVRWLETKLIKPYKGKIRRRRRTYLNNLPATEVEYDFRDPPTALFENRARVFLVETAQGNFILVGITEAKSFVRYEQEFTDFFKSFKPM